MGKLEDLEKKLYGASEESLRKRMQRRVVFPGSLRKLSTAWADPDPQSVQNPATAEKNRRLAKWFLWAFAGVFLLIAGTVAFLYFGTRGTEARVVIHDRGPIEAGELVTIPISFQNISKAVLEEVELTVILPEHTLVTEAGFDRPAPPRIIKKMNDLRPGEEGLFEVSARFFGHELETKEVQAILLYRPQNLRARFSAKAKKEFSVSRVPLAVTWEIPEILSKGQEVEARMRYTSTASLSFQNMWVRLEYPPGFSFVSAEPKPNVGENIWNIGTLEAGKEGSIVIRGRMSAEEGELKAFRAELGVFNELTKEWRQYREASGQVRIAVTPLSVQGFLGGVREATVAPGDTLQFALRYKNNTASTLRNITVRAFPEGDILDLASFSIEHGVFDFPSKAVVWTPASASELRELLPGEGSELRFSLKTRERPLVRSDRDKNLTVTLRSEISPSTVPSELEGTDLRARDSVSFRVQSKIIFSAKSLYRASPIVNSGPLPAKVGQKTSYTIVWEIRNFTNDLTDATVLAKLPPNVKWEQNVLPSSSRVSFDAGSGEVRWNIGDIKAGVGLTSPALTLAFQVSIVPSGNDVGQSPELAGESLFSALDGFVNKKVEAKGESVTTALKDEPGIETKNWKVVP